MVDYVFERHLSGGILLPANKTLSTAGPIYGGFVPTKLVLALRQHRGNAAEPVCDVVCPSPIMLAERFRIAKRAVAKGLEPIPVTTPGQD